VANGRHLEGTQQKPMAPTCQSGRFHKICLQEQPLSYLRTMNAL
jgi:hypothetical protein